MKRKFTRQEWALFLSPVLLIALVLAAKMDLIEAIDRSRRAGPNRKFCSGNLRQLGVTFVQYTQDHDDKLPLASVAGPGPTAMPGAPSAKPTRTVGWADALITYSNPSFGSVTFYQCPVSSHFNYDPSNPGYTDFYFNRRLSGLKISSVKQSGLRLLLGEGNDGTDSADATYSKSSFPAAWLADENSPAFRHQGGANYLMLDGSVQWLKPDQIATFGGRKDFFAVK